MKSAFSRIILFLAFVAATGGSAVACPACYGDTSGSKMANAATIGIFAMVVIMFVMLGTLLGMGIYFARRAKQSFPDYDELLSEDAPPQPSPGTSS